ncbi:MAG: 3-oxoacid CoA-transferase subunit B [Spirochaetales bacterium]|nr:3-oxoacid CoA-transferase subunit B [Spirochaetales bacterium]
MTAPDSTIIARRIARELKDGNVVNLGIGMPTLVSNFVPENVHITIQAENGIVGIGPIPEEGKEHRDLINAGGGFITETPGCVYTDTALSFAIIRGGHLDMTVLGALQVDREGSIANWIIPGKFVPGMGGAMDLCAGAGKVVAALKHVDKKGNSKILKKCTLPLTAYRKLNLIVTDMAFIEVTDEGLVLREIAEWTTLEEVVKCTEANLIIPDTIGSFS